MNIISAIAAKAEGMRAGFSGKTTPEDFPHSNFDLVAAWIYGRHLANSRGKQIPVGIELTASLAGIDIDNRTKGNVAGKW